MNSDVIELTRQALWLVLLLSAPTIIAASLVGLLIAFIQAATQIQEQTFQSTVKFFVVVIMLFVSATLIGGSLYEYSLRVFTDFPGLLRK